MCQRTVEGTSSLIVNNVTTVYDSLDTTAPHHLLNNHHIIHVHDIMYSNDYDVAI